MDFERLVDTITREVAARLNHYDRSHVPQGGWNNVLQTVVAAGANRVSAPPGVGAVEQQIASIIDHTALKPTTTKSDIELLCAEAAKYGFMSVCVNPFWIPLCRDLLRGHSVKLCTVVGFPLGAMSSGAKAYETAEAVAAGADEIDMVINVGALKSGYHDIVEADIRAVREACLGKVLKVILETCLLNDEEKVVGCLASKRAGADFVKTSTGFAGGGATAADVALMRRVVGETMGVKASGGVRDKKGAALMMAAGATRIGASAGVKIMQELPGLSRSASSATSSGGGY